MDASRQPGHSDNEAAAETRRCQWCSTAAPPDATHCSSCGASLAARESLAGMAIPGVTTVDPALVHDRDSALTVVSAQRKANARYGAQLAMASLSPTAALGMAAGAAAIHGLQKLVAEQPDPNALGEPSEAALTLAERLDRDEAPSAGTQPEATAAEEAAPPAVNPWSDLPPREFDPWAGAQTDPWAGAQTDPWAGAQTDPWAGAQTDPWATSGGPWSSEAAEGEASASRASGPDPDHGPTGGSESPDSGRGAGERR